MASPTDGGSSRFSSVGADKVVRSSVEDSMRLMIVNQDANQTSSFLPKIDENNDTSPTNFMP